MNKRKKVLLLAESGFIIRNLLLGKFGVEITKSHDLTVAVLNPEDSLLKEILEPLQATLIPFPREQESNNISFFKRLFHVDNLFYGLRQSSRNNNSMRITTRLFEGDSRLSKKIANRAPLYVGKVVTFFGLQNLVEDIYLKHYAKKEITQQWISQIQEVKPDIVFSTVLSLSYRYSGSSDLPPLIAAHKLGIKTCTLIQSWDNLSSKIAVLPKWVNIYMTWSKSMNNELLALNKRLSENQTRIVGSPQFDFHLDSALIMNRNAFLQNLGLDSNQKYVLIGTGTKKWMPDEMTKMIRLCKRIKNEIDDLNVIIRLHPKDDGERWKPYLNEIKSYGAILFNSSPDIPMDDGGFVPPKDFFKDQVNMIIHSEVVINSSSSLTVDAAILDKPVICIAYDLEKEKVFPEGRSKAYSQSVHYGKLVETKGVSMANSESEVVSALNDYLKNPSFLKQERKKLVETVTKPNIGNAGIEIAELIGQMF